MKLTHGVAPALLVCLAIGCAGGDDTKRFRLSGTAEFDDKPIAYGDVLFTPANGNAGPQGIANIRDGKFDTNASGGKGIAGGPTVIRVTGFDKDPGAGGKLMCEYEWTEELPRENGTFNLKVPKKGAANQRSNTQT